MEGSHLRTGIQLKPGMETGGHRAQGFKPTARTRTQACNQSHQNWHMTSMWDQQRGGQGPHTRPFGAALLLTDLLWLQTQDMAPLYMKDQQGSYGQDLLEAGVLGRVQARSSQNRWDFS